MLMTRSNLDSVDRTSAGVRAPAPMDSCHSCSFCTWQYGQRRASLSAAPAPAPVHCARLPSMSGRRRSLLVPLPATYVASSSAPSSSVGSALGMGSSSRYHRLADVHAQRAHAPGSMTLGLGAPGSAGAAAVVAPGTDPGPSSAKVTAVIYARRAPLCADASDGVLRRHLLGRGDGKA